MSSSTTLARGGVNNGREVFFKSPLGNATPPWRDGTPAWRERGGTYGPSRWLRSQMSDLRCQARSHMRVSGLGLLRRGYLGRRLAPQFLDGSEAAQDAAHLQGDEHLRGFAVGDGLEGFQVTDGDQVGGGVAIVNGLEHPLDGLTFTFGDGQLLELLCLGDLLDRLRLALGLEHPGLLDAFGLEDGSPLLALRLGDGGTAVPFRLHLAVHRLGDVRRRIDALDLDAHDARAPDVGRLIEHLAQLGVDHVAGGKGFVELQLADDVAQVGLRQLRGGEDEVGDVVLQLHRVGRLVVHDGIDGDHHIVLGDHLLRRHIDDLLAHVHPTDALDEGDDEAQTGIDHAVEAAKAFHEALLELGDDLQGSGDDDEEEDPDDDQDQGEGADFVHRVSLSSGAPTRRVPRTSTTFTSTPAGIGPESLVARHLSVSMRTRPWFLAGSMPSMPRACWPTKRLEPTGCCFSSPRLTNRRRVNRAISETTRKTMSWGISPTSA